MSGAKYGKNVHNSAELVESVARRFGLESLIGRHRLFPLWEQIVGARLAEVCRPVEIKGRTLVIKTVDSSWGHDIKMHATLILERITELTGDAHLTKLRVVTGVIEPLTRMPAAPPPLETVEVETDDIDRQLDESSIGKYPEHRRLAARIWANSRRLAKRRGESRS